MYTKQTVTVCSAPPTKKAVSFKSSPPQAEDKPHSGNSRRRFFFYLNGVAM
jgi:hypothetical protein